MILDSFLEFADNVLVTSMADATTLLSAQTGAAVVDLGTVSRDIGQGQPLYWVIQVAVAITGGTSSQWILASDAAAGISTGGGASRHILTDVYLTADLILGKTIIYPLPMGNTGATSSIPAYERFLGVLNVDVGTQTGGRINSFLTTDPHGWRAYPDASN